MSDSIERTGPLSFTQELLLLRESSGGSTPLVGRIVQIDGEINVDSFFTGLKAMVYHHEPLRTFWEINNGFPRAVVAPAKNAPNYCPSIFRELSRNQLSIDGPKMIYDVVALIKPSYGVSNSHAMIKVSPREYYWIFFMHHLVADAWSMKIYAKTFSNKYASLEDNTDVPTTSIDYALRQKTWIESEEAQIAFQWWYESIRTLNLQPVPIAPPAFYPTHHRLLRADIRLSYHVRDAVFAIAKQLKAPLLAILFSAFTFAKNRRDSNNYCAVLLNVPGRTRLGATNATGAFYNTVVFQLSTGDGLSAHELIEKATLNIIDIATRQEIPISVINFSRIQNGLTDITDLLRIRFNIIEHPLGEFILPGCIVREVQPVNFHLIKRHSAISVVQESNTQIASPTIDISVTLLPREIVLSCEFSNDIYEARDVLQFLNEIALELKRISKCSGDDMNESIARENGYGIVGDWS